MNIYNISKDVSLDETTALNQEQLDKILDQEKLKNEKENWNKLNKTRKIKLLDNYADNYAEKNNLTEEAKVNLKEFLKYNLVTTKLLKVKDVTYNKTTKTIEKISNLHYDKNRFTLKRNKQKNKTVKH